MLYIILEIFVALIILAIIIDTVTWLGKIILGIIITAGIIFLCIKFWKIAIVIIAAIVAIYFVYKIVSKGKAIFEKHMESMRVRRETIKRKKNEAQIARSRKKDERKRVYENYKWLRETNKNYTLDAIDSILYRTVENIEKNDLNDKEHKFGKYNIPYGRVNAFLGYFRESTEENEIYYYSCWPSKVEDEVREYGILIARSGIYISVQKQKENGYLVNDYHIPFAGLMSVDALDRKLICKILDRSTMLDEKIEVNIPDNIQNATAIRTLCNIVIDTQISHFMLRVATSYFENETENTVFKEKQSKMQEGVPYSRVRRSTNEFKNYMNGRQGGGYAAEYANNIIDRLKGKKVINAGQILDANGRQKKNGADRIVNGVEVQTKYYKTGAQSVEAAFENGVPKYIRSDGSGKMMQIEVPKDQYQEALERMQQKINKGELKVGAKESAKDYVRKGNVTYRQAQNIACAGNIDSLKIDALGGIQSTIPGATISMIVVFIQEVWMTDDIEMAAWEAIKSGIKVGAKGTGTYIVIMQLKRAQIPQFDKAANYIAKSKLANTSIGKTLKINKVSSTQLISLSVISIVEWGPDVYRTIRGQISLQQLMKNSTIKAIDMGGYALGSLIPGIPDEVGGLVVGTVAHFIVKRRVDQIVEDDAVKMYRILKEEYLETVGLFEFNKDEMEFITKNTICNKKLEKILRNMYASGEPQTYARYAIMDEIIIQVLSKREKMTAKNFYDGISDVIKEVG